MIVSLSHCLIGSAYQVATVLPRPLKNWEPQGETVPVIPLISQDGVLNMLAIRSEAVSELKLGRRACKSCKPSQHTKAVIKWYIPSRGRPYQVAQCHVLWSLIPTDESELGADETPGLLLFCSLVLLGLYYGTRWAMR